MTQDESLRVRWWHSIGFALMVRMSVAMFGPLAIALVWAYNDPRGKQLLAGPSSDKMLTMIGVLLLALTAETIVNVRRRLVRVHRLLGAMESLAAGEVPKNLEIGGRDEFAFAAQCVERGAQGLAAMLSDIADHAHALRTATDKLAGNAGAVTRHTAETAQGAMLLSESIGEVDAALTQLRTGADEVRGSIDAIAERAATAGRAASDGVQATAATETSVSRLEASSAQISGVVAFINTVAAQTNLLALNATIEAARAGEAGRGFAVVAGEVKDLAAQTGQATGSIDAQVEAIRSDAAATVQALHGIAAAIQQINTEQMQIGAAVDRQRASTLEMIRRVTETADTTLALTSTITELGQTASRSTDGTREVADEVYTLARIAAGLDELTRRYGCDGAATETAPPTPAPPSPAPTAPEAAGIELF